MSAYTVNDNAYENKDALYGIRFVFIVLLMLLHLKWGLYTGGLVVSFFLIIAGFMTAWNSCKKNVVYDKTGTWKYYIHKVKKLWPLYFLTTILAVLRRGIYFKGEILPTNLIAHLLMVKTWLPIDMERMFDLGGANWYISTIMFCYMVTPLLYKGICRLYNKFQKASVMLIVAVVLYIFQFSIVMSIDEPLASYTASWWLVYCSPFRVFEYAIGMLVGFWYAKRKPFEKFSAIRKRIFYSVLEFGTVMVGIYMYQNAIRVSGYITNGLYWTWLCVLVVVLAAEGQGILSMFLASRPMVYLGKLNFPMFILHQEIFAYVNVCFAGNVYYDVNAPLNYAKTILVFIIVICISDVISRAMNTKLVVRKAHAKEG